jgi:tRNA 2-thiouridine synthesizing protein A
MSDNITLLDVKGLLCPLPVLKARKVLSSLASGSILRLEATDPASVIDVPHYCNEAGHALLSHSEQDGVYIYEIERK